MVLQDKTVILSTNDLINYLEEKLGSDIITALKEFYDIKQSDMYEDLREELEYMNTLLEVKNHEISSLEKELSHYKNT